MEIPPILMLTGISVVILLVILLLLRSANSSGGGKTPKTAAGKRRLAKRLRAQRRPAKAGELFLEAGDREMALQTWLQAGLLVRAAPLLEEKGELALALEAYDSAGDHESAARVAEKASDPVGAASHYEQIHRWADAGRCWASSGANIRAGNAWWNAKEFLKAAEAYEAAGGSLEAAKAYRYLLDSSRAAGVGGKLQKTYDLAKLGKRAGQAFQRAGQEREAADSYALGGLYVEAAALYEHVGALVEASQVHIRLGALPKAADLLERAGLTEQASVVRARVSVSSGNLHQAATELEAAGDIDGAANLLMQLGDQGGAAKLYDKAGNHASAALAWGQAGEDRSAALAWERAGDSAQAVELYRSAGDTKNELRLREAAGDWVRAGHLHLLHGDMDAGEAALRKVPEGAPEFRDACRLMGEVYRSQGKVAAAAVRYRQSIEGDRPESGSADAWYWAAVCSLKADELTDALSLLTIVREYDPTFRDVQDRLEECQRLVAEELVRGGGADGRYERRGMLGKGGMGTVYRAHDLVLEREVAFKVLSPDATGHAQAREWFLREARSAASLNHPSIVTVFDFGELEGDLFIAMELVEGTNLKDLLGATGPLPLEQLRDVIVQATDALGFAHARGVIHRDIKPANLIWSDDDVLKVTDFGLAKMTTVEGVVLGELEGPGQSGIIRRPGRTQARETSQSRVMGTPAYMSPEQIRYRRVSPAADQYSLGVTMFELGTGRIPFSSGNLLRAHLHDEPPPPRTLRPDLPPWFDDVILRCLSKDPSERFADVFELRSEIPG